LCLGVGLFHHDRTGPQGGFQPGFGADDLAVAAIFDIRPSALHRVLAVQPNHPEAKRLPAPAE
jgi:hypothetical protein